MGPLAKRTIVKAAAQSVALYGVAVDSLTVSQVGRPRRAYSAALWPRKGMASNGVGLLLVDKGRLDPQLEVVKRVMAAFVKQAKRGLPNSLWGVWEDIGGNLNRYKGPISNYVRVVNWVG